MLMTAIPRTLSRAGLGSSALGIQACVDRLELDCRRALLTAPSPRKRLAIVFNVMGHLGAVERSVSSLELDGRPARTVALSRCFAMTVEDLWSAVTSRERLPRWFLPISGQLELGGRYQFEGNAGGMITTCERLSSLALTWEFGGDVSWVEVRFPGDGAGSARLALTHTAHVSELWGEYGPGAVGVGWD